MYIQLGVTKEKRKGGRSIYPQLLLISKWTKEMDFIASVDCDFYAHLTKLHGHNINTVVDVAPPDPIFLYVLVSSQYRQFS